MIQGIYLILDPGQTHGKAVTDVARTALHSGVSAVQWRQKSGSLTACWPDILAVRDLCRGSNVPFLINDRIDVALTVQADGAHVGQDDLPASAARQLIPGKILGVSVTRPEEIRPAAAAGADYLGVGPIFPTLSKPDAAPAGGLDLLRVARTMTRLPLVAIGGITCGNVEQVRAAGADAVAVISAICGASDIEPATRALSAAFWGVPVS